MGSKTGLINKSFFYTSFYLFILWIILFEFILPENNVLPQPGIVLLSIPSLFKDYSLLSHFFTTISAIYLPGMLAYLVIFNTREFILKKTGIISYFLEFISGLSVIFPALLLALLAIFWFPHFFYIEYIYSFLVTLMWLAIEFHSSKKLINESYLLAFSSMGGEKTFIDKHILWNELKPGIFKKLYFYHLDLWSLILIFEYIQDYYGLGTILRKTLYFHDFSALILTIFLILLIIIAGYGGLKLLEDKFIFWETESE